MERKIYDDLLKWKKDLNRKPLLLFGNRQVGKTYITITFGEKEYKTVAYINSDNNTELLNIVKKENTIDRIVARLSLLTGETILKNDTLIIIDNVTDENIVKAIKKFGKEENDYHIIMITSYKDKVNEFKGEELQYRNMYAMDFEEYVRALGNLELIVIVVFGALLSGFGLGLVFKSGFTTGGTDILNQILAKYGKMGLGKAMLITDGIIILLSLYIFGFSVFIYSIISLAIISFITDKVIIGISNSKTFYIITEQESMIKKFLNYQLGHGITILDARGGYTGNFEKMIMCIVPTKDYFIVKEGIKRIDPDAFFLVTDAYEVSGGSRGGKNGFN